MYEFAYSECVQILAVEERTLAFRLSDLRWIDNFAVLCWAKIVSISKNVKIKS
jgi:hypothetical protein